ncbi:MAG: hypothetical protein F4X58_02175 [Chloroflexi bacterium]|nr:hypothetical protein [Chloroflexota bacterium]MYC00711.1 hypothetical protein [Chloroflexota bacterium]
MTLPETLDVEAALIYFDAYMYSPLPGKMRMFERRGLHPRITMPGDWEVFAAILVRTTGTESNSGIDLAGYEVKSAQDRGGFEYQYHRRSWQKKFENDREADHVYIAHRDNLAFVEVWHCEGSDIASFLDAWLKDQPYSTASEQRFRRSISYRWVTEHTTLLLRIEDGRATYEYGQQ